VSTQQQRWILGGGLASGKSVVRRILADAGIPTIDADAVGHAVLEPDGPAHGAVSQRWPGTVSNGRIDRKALAEIVFNDPDELASLEGITHPYIFDTIRHRVEEIGGLMVVEMPVIAARFGSEWRRLVVDSREGEKVRRAVSRGMEKEDARARLASQPSRQEWLAVADLVIPNHGSLSELEQTVAMVVSRL